MKDNSTAVVFPGQGAQRPGMAQDFFEQFDIARQTFEEAGEAIGEDVAAICFSENDRRLNLTEFTQPCILTVEIAIFRVLQKEYDFKPKYFAGHSLGEYTALTAAGVIPFSDAVSIVRRRGALMQEAVPEKEGAMAAILFPDIEKSGYREIVEKHGAEIANLNSPSQVVISGRRTAVEAAARDLEQTKVKHNSGPDKEKSAFDIRFLEVSAPFHSSMMKSIEIDFRRYLSQFFNNFNLKNVSRVLSNFSGDFHTSAKLVENLVQQLSNSVKWIDNMHLITAHADKIFEIGPNRPLGKFFSAISCEVKSVINVRSMMKTFK